MSAPVNLAEFRGAYLLEAEELVGIANQSLLAAEAALRRGQPHAGLVRELFRAVHTIKGLSAMVGVEPVVAIAHRLETALRPVSRSGIKLSLEAVDVLLKGVRAIEQRIHALSEGKDVPEPSPELLAALDALDAAGSTAPATPIDLGQDPALRGKLGQSDQEVLAQGVAAGRNAVRLDFAPSSSRAQVGIHITSVRERIAKVAEIVKVVPISLPGGGLVFALFLLTYSSEAELAETAGVEPESVHLLARPSATALGGANEDEDDDIDEPEALASGVVRVDVARLDDAMERLSALIVTRSRLGRVALAMRDTGVDVRELMLILADNARQLRDLRASILHLRMVRVADVLASLPLLVRGLCRTTGRLVKLDVDAGLAELDKSVAERIFPAILHLVRNAVDHAIEAPDERQRLGKPEEGHLDFVCHERSNNQLEMSITDDGRGVDRQAVAKKAGRAAPENDAALLDLLCLPGLSTREQATTTSGRGMGMDIVKRIIVDQLGGEMLIRTAPGRGTTFTLRIPLTISIVDAFTFECGSQRFVVPVAMVEEIVELDPARLVRGPSRANSPSPGMFERRGEAMPVVELETLFKLGPDGGLARRALVVRRHGQPTAFAVDRLVGQQEVVVRPLEDPLVKVPGVAGATDLGDGKPTLVLDLTALSATLTHALEVAS